MLGRGVRMYMETQGSIVGLVELGRLPEGLQEPYYGRLPRGMRGSRGLRSAGRQLNRRGRRYILGRRTKRRRLD